MIWKITHLKHCVRGRHMISAEPMSAFLVGKLVDGWKRVRMKLRGVLVGKETECPNVEKNVRILFTAKVTVPWTPSHEH